MSDCVEALQVCPTSDEFRHIVEGPLEVVADCPCGPKVDFSPTKTGDPLVSHQLLLGNERTRWVVLWPGMPLPDYEYTP